MAVMKQPFAGKVALVTGANKGIGLQTSLQLGRLGFTVVMGARDAARGAQAVKDLKAAGVDVRFLKLDTTQPGDRDAAYQFVVDQFGKLDALVNNAAVALDRNVKPSEVSEDILRQTFEANFFAVVLLTQKLLPLLRKSDAGRIVNLSSNLASLTLHSEPSSDIYDVKLLAYDASKTALNAFTIHLAHELKDTKIKVNAAHPGWVKTDMGGEGALMDVADGAHTSVELATLPTSGPTGGFFHLGETVPW
jgi:NAD(P)-dependent dehydrogenase (short-subunit alcohol dehydrogenase family)